MNFGQAIEALKEGEKVCRSGWNGKGMYLWLLPATEIYKEWVKDPMLLEAFGDRNTLPCLGSIRMLTATKEVLTGWLASQTDILAEDWEIYDNMNSIESSIIKIDVVKSIVQEIDQEPQSMNEKLKFNLEKGI